MRRYPLSLLVEAAGCSEAALGRRVGLSGTTLKHAREFGLTADAADRYAIRAELHPVEVWPEWHDEIETEAKRRYNARKAAAERDRYRRDPRRREQAKINAHNYYVTCPDYMKAKKRAYYAANRDWVRERRRLKNVRNKEQNGVEFPITTSVDWKPIKKGLIAS